MTVMRCGKIRHSHQRFERGSRGPVQSEEIGKRAGVTRRRGPEPRRGDEPGIAARTGPCAIHPAEVESTAGPGGNDVANIGKVDLDQGRPDRQRRHGDRRHGRGRRSISPTTSSPSAPTATCGPRSAPRAWWSSAACRATSRNRARRDPGTGIVEGDVQRPASVVAEGAVLNGAIKMTKKAGAAADRSPPPRLRRPAGDRRDDQRGNQATDEAAKSAGGTCSG